MVFFKSNLPLRQKQSSTWFEFYRRQKLQSQKTWKYLVFWLGMVCAVAVIGCVIYIIAEISDTVKTVPDFQVDYSRLKITQLPQWLQPFTQEIKPVGLSTTGNIFDDELLNTIADAYVENPWVARVPKIRKSYPNQIHVQLVLRRPVAYVASKECRFLIDAQGVRLPGRYPAKSPSPSYFLPEITGIETSPPLPGKKWQDPHLQNSLKILTFLAEHQIYRCLPFSGIAVKKENHCKAIHLVLENEKTIAWGRCLQSPIAEISLSRKLQSLQQLYRYLKVQENLSQMRSADIRFGYLLITKREERRNRYRRGRRNRRRRRR